jgi:signal transduction histidine kinase
MLLMNVRSHLKLEHPLVQNRSYSCVKKHFQSSKILNTVVKMTASMQKIEQILQQVVDLLAHELKLYGCLIHYFPQSNELYKKDIFGFYLSQLIINNADCVEIAQKIFQEQSQVVLESTNYVLNNLEGWEHQLITLDSSSSAFNIITFPIIDQETYLGNLLFLQAENYSWTVKEIELGEMVAGQIAIAMTNYQLRQENYYLKQKENIAQKIDDITHELRSPVSAIVSFSKMLSKEIYGTLNPKQTDYVNRIVSSGEYLLDLANDLLDLAKINAQKEELILTNINIEALCQEAMVIIEEQAKHKGINLILKINTVLKTVQGDERRLKQILINLLSNSLKFTQQGSITLEVNVQDHNLLFAVIDTGIGIEALDQSKLFQPFQQMSNHLKIKEKGTGLGLTLSQQLAYLHGGKITCQSELNQGSCFTLHLPIN